MSKEKIDAIYLHDKYNIKGFFYEYRFLSNSHICDIYFDGLLYTSTESAYQAGKLSHNKRKPFTIMSPSEAMKEGRLRHLDSEKAYWDTIKIEVMFIVLVEKFKIPELRAMLLATGDKYLEETNWWGDVFWGVCDGKGKNKLGQLLMIIRDYYRELEELKNDDIWIF